eukprot:1231512-Pyramimonas_sp.AAC.1
MGPAKQATAQKVRHASPTRDALVRMCTRICPLALVLDLHECQRKHIRIVYDVMACGPFSQHVCSPPQPSDPSNPSETTPSNRLQLATPLTSKGGATTHIDGLVGGAVDSLHLHGVPRPERCAGTPLLYST